MNKIINEIFRIIVVLMTGGSLLAYSIQSSNTPGIIGGAGLILVALVMIVIAQE